MIAEIAEGASFVIPVGESALENNGAVINSRSHYVVGEIAGTAQIKKQLQIETQLKEDILGCSVGQSQCVLCVRVLEIRT